MCLVDAGSRRRCAAPWLQYWYRSKVSKVTRLQAEGTPATCGILNICILTAPTFAKVKGAVLVVRYLASRKKSKLRQRGASRMLAAPRLRLAILDRSAVLWSSDL